MEPGTSDIVSAKLALALSPDRPFSIASRKTFDFEMPIRLAFAVALCATESGNCTVVVFMEETFICFCQKPISAGSAGSISEQEKGGPAQRTRLSDI
jgi:hypothetical protein